MRFWYDPRTRFAMSVANCFFLMTCLRSVFFQRSGSVERLETAFVELYADGVRRFILDGLADQFLGTLGNVGGADEDDFSSVGSVDAVNVCVFAHNAR
jgi:hypothetical protein